MKSATFVVSIRPQGHLDFVDLTDELVRAIKDSGVVEGCTVVYCAHTTCGLLINEWEEGALQDLHRRLEVLVPRGSRYAHDDLERRKGRVAAGERLNGRAHVAQMILGGTSQAIPVSAGDPALGTWQRLFLVELDGAQERKVLFHVFGE